MNMPLVEIHTADIHFGALDPRVQYEILTEQMLNKVRTIHFDAFFINGDLFEHKYMSNSDVVMYALLFVDDIVKLCVQNNATLVILHGTASHDADQLKLFYRYINSGADVRIVEQARFEDIKGTRVLCLPEESGKGYEYYENLLFFSGDYDMAVLHGTVKGSVHGADEADLDKNSPVFDIRCFQRCNGPILCGHIHTPGCYQNHIYYCGSPLRWKFGEEQEKGFMVCVYNPVSHQYYINFEPIQSFRYDTFDLDNMVNEDPKKVIDHILYLKSQGIDHIRIKFSSSNTTTDVVKQFFATRPNVVIKIDDSGFKQVVEDNQKISDKYEKYKYVTSDSMTPNQIMVQYVNQEKNEAFITVDEFIEILEKW